MRLTNSGGPRAEWFDRNPTPLLLASELIGTGPAGTTTMWTYTVPSSRKAYFGGSVCDAHRAVAASVAGQIVARILATVPPSVETSISHSIVRTNNVGDGYNVPLSLNWTFLAGQTMRGTFQDTSSGGSSDIVTSASAVEFDA